MVEGVMCCLMIYKNNWTTVIRKYSTREIEHSKYFTLCWVPENGLVS